MFLSLFVFLSIKNALQFRKEEKRICFFSEADTNRNTDADFNGTASIPADIFAD